LPRRRSGAPSNPSVGAPELVGSPDDEADAAVASVSADGGAP
jgi:hypothetical protein